MRRYFVGQRSSSEQSDTSEKEVALRVGYRKRQRQEQGQRAQVKVALLPL